MTDITVTTTTFADNSRWWLLFEAEGNPGPVPRLALPIDFSKFTAGTHYANGYIASGTVLGKVTATGKVGPYDDAASDGRQTAVGFLYNNVIVPASTSQKVSVAVLDCFAVVSESRLPTNHGLDANGKADLSKIVFRA
jgi:hypothetical protein